MVGIGGSGPGRSRRSRISVRAGGSVRTGGAGAAISCRRLAQPTDTSRSTGAARATVSAGTVRVEGTGVDRRGHAREDGAATGGATGTTGQSGPPAGSVAAVAAVGTVVAVEGFVRSVAAGPARSARSARSAATTRGTVGDEGVAGEADRAGAIDRTAECVAAVAAQSSIAAG